MNTPRWLLVFLSEEFTGSQVDLIDKNWYRFSQLSLSNSTREDLIREARHVLELGSACS